MSHTESWAPHIQRFLSKVCTTRATPCSNFEEFLKHNLELQKLYVPEWLASGPWGGDWSCCISKALGGTTVAAASNTHFSMVHFVYPSSLLQILCLQCMCRDLTLVEGLRQETCQFLVHSNFTAFNSGSHAIPTIYKRITMKMWTSPHRLVWCFVNLPLQIRRGPNFLKSKKTRKANLSISPHWVPIEDCTELSKMLALRIVRATLSLSPFLVYAN